MFQFKMRETMKCIHLKTSILLLLLQLVFITMSCMDDVDTNPKNLIGRWRMEKVIDKGKTYSKPDSKNWRYKDVEIEFMADGNIEGTLSYDTFTGDYKTVEDSIAFTYWPSNKVGDSEWAYLLDGVIRSVNRFSLRKNAINLKYKELRLIHQDGELVFDRVK
ncbi:hypothetical protein CLV60_12552 [Dyadobacter jiangsuensis]|uniref:Lipocalin-like protein n=2 Tax=Dyadobacter jiangsuensis TaxID=1591085 RepID=A0A2P8FDS8_9BACT|nr:hypothetical protein CLV60_12552 [Dyadobacter jiangsuensis]